MAGLAGIVGDREGLYPDTRDPKAGAKPGDEMESLHRGCRLSAPGPGRRPDRDAVPARQGGVAPDVVTMLMGHQNSVQVPGGNTQQGQSPLGLPDGKDAIHQQPDTPTLHQEGITPAATAQASEAHARLRGNPGHPRGQRI